MVVSQVYSGITRITGRSLIMNINYVIEGQGALENEVGKEQALKAGDFDLVNTDEQHGSLVQLCKL